LLQLGLKFAGVPDLTVIATGSRRKPVNCVVSLVCELSGRVHT
jgi:hypothetical protein